MSESLASAAEKMGVPEAIVRRSAEARAKATGASTDDILAAWAGGEAAAAGTPPPAAATPAPESAAETAATAPEPTPAPAASEPAAAPAPAAPGAVEPIPAPAEVTPREALDHPVVISVPTMGIAERTMAAVPRWIAAAFLIIPIFGLLYLAGSGSADAVCSDDDIRLQRDVVTGGLENCDGSQFEGRAAGGGGGGAQFLAVGEAQYAGCASCHGANGEGGIGPAFGGVTATFTSCLDHVEWVRLGTNGFRSEGRDTYGDLAKPVGGGGIMPGFATLTDEQLASVVAFERVRFGGADPNETFVDCGLVEAPEGEDTGTEEGSEEGAPADGTEAPAEGEAAPEAARVTRSS